MGAWIETSVSLPCFTIKSVAPRVGAWIETSIIADKVPLCVMSHPVWVRGLKQEGNQFNAEQNQVAPRVGAWIETRG